MKGRITTVLSLTGVLVAGSAAALVNTQVLQNTESQSSGQVTVGSPDTANTSTPDTITTVDPVTGDVLPGSQVTKIQSNVLTPTQAMYQIGDAGLVTLDTSGNVLTIVSVAPNAGWTVVKAENYSPVDIEVKLQNGSTIVEFKANLQAGVITTTVESKIEDNGGTTPGNGSTVGSGTTPGSGTINDGDDDSHEDDSGDDSGHGGDDD